MESKRSGTMRPIVSTRPSMSTRPSFSSRTSGFAFHNMDSFSRLEKKKIKKEITIAEDEPPSILHGVYVFANGDRYEGEYTKLEDGTVVRCGSGKHISSNGIVCEGKWKGNKMNERGVVTFPSGACYKGELVDNMMHGKGTYVFPDGSIYEGGFINNRLSGNGTFVDQNGQIWCGVFNDKSATSLRFKLNM